MPWKNTTMMGQKIVSINKWRSGKSTLSDRCRRFVFIAQLSKNNHNLKYQGRCCSSEGDRGGGVLDISGTRCRDISPKRLRQEGERGRFERNNV
jgi:hypothetical protein